MSVYVSYTTIAVLNVSNEVSVFFYFLLNEVTGGRGPSRMVVNQLGSNINMLFRMFG